MSAVPDRSAARMRRLRARRKGQPDPAAPQPCPECGRLVRSMFTAPLCSRCWKRSPAGREANRLRMAKVRSAGVTVDEPATDWRLMP
jgi:hypothetical protein